MEHFIQSVKGKAVNAHGLYRGLYLFNGLGSSKTSHLKQEKVPRFFMPISQTFRTTYRLWDLGKEKRKNDLTYIIMTLQDLADILSDMYNNAPRKDQVTMIHLFGIKYANLIIENGYSRKEIIKKSNIPESYLVELNKGIRLSNYVVVKLNKIIKL